MVRIQLMGRTPSKHLRYCTVKTIAHLVGPRRSIAGDRNLVAARESTTCAVLLRSLASGRLFDRDLENAAEPSRWYPLHAPEKRQCDLLEARGERANTSS
jgi:hypothetical protein